MKKLLVFLFLFAGIAFYGCDTTEPNADPNTDIPADPQNVTVPATTINNIQPTAVFTPAANNPGRIKVNLTGLINPVTQQPITLFYDLNSPASSNIFITEDGVVKGLKVTKVSTGNILNADLVFVVDNSGSMSEEADSIAASIIEFANFLQTSGLNVQFAVVGYSSGGVNGGINFTTAQILSTYLNRETGTSRTRGFSGADSAALVTRADNFGEGTGENGVIAAIFADSVYNWRSGAQRVIINFTDEPTQSDGNMWNNAMGCSLLGGKATVHTVFSQDSTYYNWSSTDERPWDLSNCTGGTNIFIPTDAAGLDLKNLPVAGALSNSYLVEYRAGSTGTSHTVVITIKENNADGKREYTVTY
ncbi:MAG TPA: vWA domain-containing protein [Ignavibacteriaceae bacterium]|nr:vWA domain-containing protein [Ignavibacteriaceae bacterium]